MPKDLAWEETLSSRTNKTTDERGGDWVEEGEKMCEMDEEEEDEREQSLSVPASPTLTRRALPSGRVQRLHSQSFDDIISSVNNEDTLSPPPSITPGDRDRRHREGQVSAQNFAFEPTPPPMLDSGSDSGTEPLPQRYGLGTVYDHTHLVSSQPEIASSERSSSSAHGTGGGRGGRLNQLRGKLLGRVRRGQGKTHQSVMEVPLQPIRPHSHHITSDGGPEDTRGGTDATGGGTEATGGGREDTGTNGASPPSFSSSQLQQGSLVTNRLLAVGQRFRNAPPSLLRRMGVVGGGQHHMTQAPPPVLQHSDDSVNESARRKSNSNFISL